MLTEKENNLLPSHPHPLSPTRHHLNAVSAKLESLSSSNASIAPVPSPISINPTRRRRPTAANNRRSLKAATQAAVRRARTHSPPVSRIGGSPAQRLSLTPMSPLQLKEDITMMEIDTPAPSGNGLAKLRLPSRLGRPEAREVAPEILKLLDPELEHIPAEYIKDNLTEAGHTVLKTLRQCHILPPKDKSVGLPRTLQVLVASELLSTTPEDIPTHVIAIVPRHLATSTSPPPKRTITLHLTHSLIFGTHASSLPIEAWTPPPELLQQDNSEGSPYETTNRTLPVIPLSLPSPISFAPLHFWLYTKNTPALICSIIPLPPHLLGLGPQSSLSIPQLSKTLARTFTATALRDIAGKTHGVWANACALGVWEEELWNVIDLVWCSVVEAFKLSAPTQGKTS